MAANGAAPLSGRSWIHAIAGVLAIACTLICVPSGHAQGDAVRYPDKPVRLVVPFPPGGAVEYLARMLSQRLGERWGQAVVVENRPGANGNLAAEAVAKSPPDAHTLLLGTNGTHATNAALYASLPYDPIADFSPIGLLTSLPHVLVTSPALQVSSVAELIALARRKPAELKYGSAGNAGSLHLSAELFKSMTGVDMVHVPYKGGGPAVADLLASRTDLMFAVVPIVMNQIRAGKLKGLAVSSRTRFELLPDLPTFSEAGLIGYESTAWIGLLAPARTPRSRIDKVLADSRHVLADRDVRAQLINQGFLINDGSPEDFAAFIRSETTKWGNLVKQSGAKID